MIKIDDAISISLDQRVAPQVYDDALRGLQLLDGQYHKGHLNLYYDLAALNPLLHSEDKYDGS